MSKITIKYKICINSFEDLPSHMFKSKIEDNFEFQIYWQNPYIIRIRESARNVCTSRSKRSGDTPSTGPCTCECRWCPEAATQSGHIHIIQ